MEWKDNKDAPIRHEKGNGKYLGKVWKFVETVGSILGFALLFGPPAWQEVNRGVTSALLVVLIVAGGFGLFLLTAIIRSQLEPPYEEKT